MCDGGGEEAAKDETLSNKFTHRLVWVYDCGHLIFVFCSKFSSSSCSPFLCASQPPSWHTIHAHINSPIIINVTIFLVITVINDYKVEMKKQQRIVHMRRAPSKVSFVLDDVEVGRTRKKCKRAEYAQTAAGSQVYDFLFKPFFPLRFVFVYLRSESHMHAMISYAVIPSHHIFFYMITWWPLSLSLCLVPMLLLLRAGQMVASLRTELISRRIPVLYCCCCWTSIIYLFIFWCAKRIFSPSFSCFVLLFV